MLWLGLSGLGSCHSPPHTDEFMLISVCLHMVLHVLLRTRGDSGATLHQNFNKIQDKTSSIAPMALYARHTNSTNPNTSQLVEEKPWTARSPPPTKRQEELHDMPRHHRTTARPPPVHLKLGPFRGARTKVMPSQGKLNIPVAQNTYLSRMYIWKP